MKKLSIFLIATAVMVTQLNQAVLGNDSPLANKTWLQELPPNPILYGQPFLTLESYRKLTIEQQQSYKVSYFINKKFTPLNRKILIHTVPFISSIPIILIAFNVANKFLGNNVESEDLATFIKIYGGIVAACFAPIYLGWGKLAYNSLANRFWDRIDDPVEKYEIDYVKKKEFLSNGTSSEMEKQFSISRADPTRLSNVVNFAETALKMPLNNALIDFDKKKIDTIFEGYDPILKDQVKAFALRQVLMQEVSLNAIQPFREGKRIAAYFQGLPGSGKTRFAELTAKSLDLPFARISLEGSSISDLVGRNVNTGDPTPGLIVQALTNAQFNGKTAKNTVLFIDEADRVINDSKSEILPFLLKLLDPESKTFFNPYLNTDVDISNLTIILAGNYDIQDEALRKRLQIINFKGFTAEFKKQIIWKNTLHKMCSSYSKNGKYKISSSDFTKEDVRKIDELIELDQDPGFRTIESVLMDYLDHKVMIKYFDKSVPFPKLKEKIELSNLEQQAKKQTAVKN